LLFRRNLGAQIRETMTNIKAMHAEANRLASQPRFELSSLYCLPSLRHAADPAQPSLFVPGQPG